MNTSGVFSGTQNYKAKPFSVLLPFSSCCVPFPYLWDFRGCEVLYRPPGKLPWLWGAWGWKKLGLNSFYPEKWSLQIYYFSTSASCTIPLKLWESRLNSLPKRLCASSSSLFWAMLGFLAAGAAGSEMSQWVLKCALWTGPRHVRGQSFPCQGLHHLLVLFCSWNAQNDLFCALCWAPRCVRNLTAVAGGSGATRCVRRRIKFYESSWFHCNL